MSSASEDKTPTKAGGAKRPRRSLKTQIHIWLRWLHTYISMFSLIAILFFSLTGITLNHPEWGINNRETRRETTGKLPAGWEKDHKIDWFKVTEHLRANEGVRGKASEPREDENEGELNFEGPGYDADVIIERPAGTYTVSSTSQGVAGLMNDFHRGRKAGTAWSLMIDLSGICLSLVAMTGLGIIYFLKKVRTAAVMATAVGLILLFIGMRLGMG